MSLVQVRKMESSASSSRRSVGLSRYEVCLMLRSSQTNFICRGNACLACRRRKMVSITFSLFLPQPHCTQRCDGARPVCTQCLTRNRADDCEYTTGQGPTRSQLLEENIALLETRIRELEHKDDTTPSVQLQVVPNANAGASSGSQSGNAVGIDVEDGELI